MRSSCFPVLPRSAESQAIWGGIVKRLLIAYFIGNISAKKISKCVNVCQSYSKPKVGRFLSHIVVLTDKFTGITPHAFTSQRNQYEILIKQCRTVFEIMLYSLPLTHVTYSKIMYAYRTCVRAFQK